jgi:choice-of-anchor A domain-containing protein
VTCKSLVYSSFFLAILSPVPCLATSLSLGGAANYVVFDYNSTGVGQTQFSISGGSVVVQGPLASAANNKVNFSGMPPSGPLYQSSVNTGGDNYNGIVPITGATVDANLLAASTMATAQSAYYMSLSAPNANVVSTTVTGGQTFKGNGGVNVFDLNAGINMTNGTAITVSGTINDIFIFNVTTQFVSNNGGSVTLTGGVTASDIIWNYVGTGDVAFTGGSIANNDWEGTILAPVANIDLHDRRFDGAFISGGNIAITSNPAIYYTPFTPPPPPTPSVPEPSTYISGVAGLAVIGFLARKRLA